MQKVFSNFMVGLACSVSAWGQGAEVSSLTPVFTVRPRVEWVDDGKVDRNNNGADDTKTATALTTRLTLGIKVDTKNEHLKAYFEATHVGVSLNDFNSTSQSGNSHQDYAVIIDPPNTRISQGYILFKPNKNFEFSIGRKALALDDQRFVGTVGWRQMPQTFGVAEIKSQYGRWTLQLDYVFERYGIKDELNALWSKGTILGSAGYSLNERKISFFAYSIQDAHDTLGLSYENVRGPLFYNASYALQKNPSFKKDVSPAKKDSYYYDLTVKYTLGMAALNFNFHTLGEDKANKGGTGFATPLATLHKFEGWSDVLLPLAANGSKLGLTDVNLGASYRLNQHDLVKVVYHQFKSAKKSKDYGSEVDVLYHHELGKKTSASLKAAFYSQGDDSSSENVQKIWAMTTHSL